MSKKPASAYLHAPTLRAEDWSLLAEAVTHYRRAMSRLDPEMVCALDYLAEVVETKRAARLKVMADNLAAQERCRQRKMHAS